MKTLKNAVLPKNSQFRKLLLGPAAGCVMQIDFAHHTRLYLGLYERQLNPYMKQLVRPGCRSFDVGGQGGYDALILAKLSGGAVVSFECDPQAAEEMRQTFARNPFDIKTVEAFVGSGDGCLSLDEAASRMFMPDFIKMDIEGAEVEALAGAETILSTRKPHMIIEVHGKPQEEGCLETLARHGYAPEIVNQPKTLRDHRPLDHNRWLVCRGRSSR